MKIRKRIIASLLFLACLAFPLCGAGAEAFVPASLRYTAAPEEAFGGDDSARIIAVGEGGSKLLVSSKAALYLWDAAAGLRMPVYFTSAEDLEALGTLAETMLLSEKSPDVTREFLARHAAEYLAENGLERFENLDQLAALADGVERFNGLYAESPSGGDDYALVMTRMGLNFTVNLHTGEARMIPDSSAETSREQMRDVIFDPVLCGNLLLSSSGVTNLDTGETVCPAPALPGSMPDDQVGPVMAAARLLPDGRILLLAPGAIDRKTRSRNYYLIVLGTESSSVLTVFSGAMGAGPDSLFLSGDGRYVAVANCIGASMYASFLVDLETGDIREFGGKEDSVLVLGEYSGGFVCCGLSDGAFFRLDAASALREPIALAGEDLPTADTHSFLVAHDRFYCFGRRAVRGWFTAE